MNGGVLDFPSMPFGWTNLCTLVVLCVSELHGIFVSSWVVLMKCMRWSLTCTKKFSNTKHTFTNNYSCSLGWITNASLLGLVFTRCIPKCSCNLNFVGDDSFFFKRFYQAKAQATYKRYNIYNEKSMIPHCNLEMYHIL